MTSSLLAGYFDAGGEWIACAPEWTDIREAPRHRVWRVLDSDGATRLARWGAHAHTGEEGWVSAVDPYLLLDPTQFRDLPKPAHLIAEEMRRKTRRELAIPHGF